VSDASPLVELVGVSCTYGQEVVLEEVSLRLEGGDLVGVVGPSGAGKSTLLRAVLGCHPPSAGVLRRRPGLRIGYVPQVETVNWDFPVTLGEVAAMRAGITGRLRWPWPSPAERARVRGVLERLELLDLEDRPIRALSGGQQQRMFIARALCQEAELLVLDEPTSSVDVRTRHDVLHLLAELNREQGLTILLSTHDLNGLAAHLPRLACLNRRLIACGDPSEVLVPEVLEATYGAPLDILEHGGLRFVVDRHPHRVTGAG
jgi:ABC-type Mn2+/Zn2+ transport system ATPase subunit